jgi:hypothetical protein
MVDLKCLTWCGQIGMAAMLAGEFTVKQAIFMSGWAMITFQFIGPVVLFPLK